MEAVPSSVESETLITLWEEANAPASAPVTVLLPVTLTTEPSWPVENRTAEIPKTAPSMLLLSILP
ncbi:hypothetical protein D3C84_1122070 [compost metagenome]